MDAKSLVNLVNDFGFKVTFKNEDNLGVSISSISFLVWRLARKI